jgi:hypothetical protein
VFAMADEIDAVGLQWGFIGAEFLSPAEQRR